MGKRVYKKLNELLIGDEIIQATYWQGQNIKHDYSRFYGHGYELVYVASDGVWCSMEIYNKDKDDAICIYLNPKRPTSFMVSDCTHYLRNRCV